MRTEMYKLIRQVSYKRNKKQLLLSTLKKLKKNHDIILIKTNKSNKILVLDRAASIEKMAVCIADMECEVLHKDLNLSIFHKVQQLVRA